MKIRSTMCTLFLTVFGAAFVQGEGVFDENCALKAKFAEQEKVLRSLSDKILNLKNQTASLKKTNSLLNGETVNVQQKTETIIWNFKLDSSKAFTEGNWPKFAKSVKDGDSTVLKISGDGETQKAAFVMKWFSSEDFEKAKGKAIVCSVMCKGDGINGKGQAKFTLMVTTEDRKKTYWPNVPIGNGSFNWRELKFEFNMPWDAKGATMIFGLQAATAGSVYYRDLKIAVLD